MASVGQARATLDDWLRAEGKTELIKGRIVELMATGHKPNRVAGRETFSPDASSYSGPLPANVMRFIAEAEPAVPGWRVAVARVFK